MQILVVEDDPDIRLTLEQNLGDAGYVVCATGTATDALRLANASRPDLVLLDLMLPDRPGTEVCRVLRANPVTRGIPVIMVTARANEDDRIAGLEHDADDYVQKPFSMRELLLRVEAVLKRNRSREPALRTETRVDAQYAAAREQIRVWEGFSANHLERGEWRECQEICRTILRRYAEQLTPPEMALFHERIRRCAEEVEGVPVASTGSRSGDLR